MRGRSKKSPNDKRRGNELILKSPRRVDNTEVTTTREKSVRKNLVALIFKTQFALFLNTYYKWSQNITKAGPFIRSLPIYNRIILWIALVQIVLLQSFLLLSAPYLPVDNQHLGRSILMYYLLRLQL